jgi:co-chaperonin GroES (HSP10)
MNLTVVGERVFIKPEQLPEMNSEGTLFLPGNRAGVVMCGTVAAVGDGPVGKGIFLPHIVNVGDRVVFAPDSGEEIIFEKDLYIAMREIDILAVIEPSHAR